MQIDQNNSIGSRVVFAYFPDHPGRTVVFRLGKGERHPVRFAVSTEFTMYLSDSGRGSIQLPAPEGNYYTYAVTAPDGLTATGGLTASAGAISLHTWLGLGASDYLFAANNLSDLVSAATAQNNLELLPGRDVLMFYAALNDLGLLTNTSGAADKLPYMNAADSFALATFTAFARSLVAAVDAAAARTVLDVPATGDVATALDDLDTTVTGAQLDADHIKLAGIESSATADQTASEIEAIVSHDNLLDFAANEHVTLPNTIANVLNDAGTMASADTDDYVPASGGEFTGDVQIVTGSSPTLRLSSTASNKAISAAVDLMETDADFGTAGAYGARIKYDGSNNRFVVQTGDATTVTDAVYIDRNTGNVTILTPLTVSDRAEITQPSATAAKPVLQLEQKDVDEPAMKIIGTAAAADLTRTIVAEADVTTATRAGFVKVEVQDDGNQITDQDYYMPVYTLA